MFDPIEGDGTGPIVLAEEFHREFDDTTDIYRGTKVRFRNIRGTFKVVVKGRGGVIGSFVQGRVTISDPVDGDGTGPIVTGDDFPPIERNETTTTWRGNKVRFRIIGGTFKVVVKGRGINLSFVGKGNVIITGAGTEDDGTYAVNGGSYSLIPGFPLPFSLSATTP